MADDNYDEMFGGENAEDDQKPKETGGGLRKQLEATLAELKKEREAREKLDAQVKQNTIRDTFRELEVPDKVSKFYAGEPDRDKILEWVKENADVFGISVAGTETEEEQQQNSELKEVHKAGQVGFDAGDRAPETIAQTTEAGIRSGKMSEQDVDAAIAKMFGR